MVGPFLARLLRLAHRGSPVPWYQKRPIRSDKWRERPAVSIPNLDQIVAGSTPGNLASEIHQNLGPAYRDFESGFEVLLYGIFTLFPIGRVVLTWNVGVVRFLLSRYSSLTVGLGPLGVFPTYTFLDSPQLTAT